MYIALLQTFSTVFYLHSFKKIGKYNIIVNIFIINHYGSSNVFALKTQLKYRYLIKILTILHFILKINILIFVRSKKFFLK